MSKRILFMALIAAALGGCADPPGLAKPKPFDYQEEQQATSVYQKYKGHFQAIDGVMTSYLTANNNPRAIMVVVRDKETAEKVRARFGRRVDGLRLRTSVVDRDVPDDAPIEAVPTQTLPDTWWGKVLGFFQGWSPPWLPKPEN